MVKQLFVKADHKLSLQYHRIKTEHITLISGKARMYLEYDDGHTEFLMDKMAPVFIEPGTIHRLMADGEDALFIEISTPELDDVIRLEDDYGREDDLNASVDIIETDNEDEDE